MKYLQSRDVKHYLVNYLQNVFKMSSNWVNTGQEVVELSGDNSPKVYEQYPFENENYPIIAMIGGNSRQDDWGVDSLVRTAYLTEVIGARARTYSTLDSSSVYCFGVNIADSSLEVRNIGVALKAVTAYMDEDITLSVYSSGSAGPQNVLASGSIDGKTLSSTNIEWGYAAVTPTLTLTKGTSYFVVLDAPSGTYGDYYLIRDNSISTLSSPFLVFGTSGSTGWTFDTDSTPLAVIQGPAHRQVGGGIFVDISILVEAKDLATTQKLAELTFVHLNTLRYSNLKRESMMTYKNETRSELDRASDLTTAGINIISVDKGSESVRERGNDRIFGITLNVSCYGRWSEEFRLSTLEDIAVTINNY